MVDCKYKNIFTPIRIGNLTIKNRIFAAPTSFTWLDVDGNLTPEIISHYELIAKGGAAVVTYGESIVHAATGKSHDRQMCLDNPTCLISLSQLVRAIKRHGAVPNIQLSHGGKWGGLVSLAGSQKGDKVSYGPSAEILPEGQVLEMPKELLLEIIESFGKGAAVIKRAGFEMCMVHAGHGWLFGQFLSERTNHRTDEFGISFENRARPLVMALESIRRNVGPGFPIEVRISGDEFIEGGITLKDAIRLVKLIEDKCDLINVSAGIHENLELFIRTHPSPYIEKGPNVYLAQAIRKEAKIPISTVGGITEPALMEEIITSGKADIIELARPLMADPELPNKLRSGREKEITKCLRCNGCHGESVKTGLTSCVINPVTGNERNDWIARCQPTSRKKVMVAGGGPGGMKAALTAAERGHEVVLYEKSGRLGGALKFAQHVDFKYGLYEFKEVLEYLLTKSTVTVHLNSEVTKETVQKEKPDVLLLAVGAKPIIPRIPGIDSTKVMNAESIFGKESSIGKKIVVLGGGLVGCETAAHLGRLGKHVTVVEMLEDVATDVDVFGQTAVKVDMKKNNVHLITCATGVAVTDKGLKIRRQDGSEEIIPADTVINAVGYRTDHKLFNDLSQEAPIVQMVGDFRKPGKVTNAVSDGYYLSLDI